MLVYVKKVLKTIDGADIIATDGKQATIGGALIDALLATYQSEVSITGQDKLKRYQLAMRIANEENDAVAMNLDEARLCKDLVGMAFAPIVVGQVWSELEGDKK